jgi:hypothetical protein
MVRECCVMNELSVGSALAYLCKLEINLLSNKNIMYAEQNELGDGEIQNKHLGAATTRHQQNNIHFGRRSQKQAHIQTTKE